MTSEAPKLLPCPFCGSSDLRFSEYMTDGGPRENIVCEDCSAELGGWKKKGTAIDAWNTRDTTHADAQAALDAMLKAERDALKAKLAVAVEALNDIADGMGELSHREIGRIAPAVARAALRAIAGEGE